MNSVKAKLVVYTASEAEQKSLQTYQQQQSVVCVHALLLCFTCRHTTSVAFTATSWTQYPRHAATFVNLWCIDH
jgi:hypothetical protein